MHPPSPPSIPPPQTKETLTTKASAFGSKCEVSEELLKKVMKTGVVENIVQWAQFKQSKELKKTDGAKRSRLTGIVKLDDANEAGTRNSNKCTLILTEGDSAKALAIAGLSVVGRDYYGVFPVRPAAAAGRCRPPPPPASATPASPCWPCACQACNCVTCCSQLPPTSHPLPA